MNYARFDLALHCLPYDCFSQHVLIDVASEVVYNAKGDNVLLE